MTCLWNEQILHCNWHFPIVMFLLKAQDRLFMLSTVALIYLQTETVKFMSAILDKTLGKNSSLFSIL